MENKNISSVPKQEISSGVQAGLNSLKAKAPVHEGLEAKMPSKNPQSNDPYKKIEVPTKSKLHDKNEVSKEMPKPIGLVAAGGIKTPSDRSIFEGKELTRKQLEYKLRTDPKSWQAARASGLANLTPLERAKYAQDIPRIFGSNISHSDIEGTLRKLNKDLANAQNKPTEHAKIRKEISFFKGINRK